MFCNRYLGPQGPHPQIAVNVDAVGDVVRVVLTDAAGVVLLGAPEVGRDILYGLAVVASAGAAFAGHISSLRQHFDTHGRLRYC